MNEEKELKLGETCHNVPYLAQSSPCRQLRADSVGRGCAMEQGL